MILVDTNIIINFWKKPDKKVKEVFENHTIVISGVTKAELIHGAKSEKEIDLIIESLKDFDIIEVKDSNWIETGRILNKLKNKGISVPFQDAIMAQIAIENDIDLWTNDKHFSMIQKEIKELKLFRVLA